LQSALFSRCSFPLFSDLRYKSVFKVRAFQVSPDELEAHIRTHPDINEVCVVSVPDLYSGEVPVAFVVLGDEALDRIAADQKEMKKIKVGILRVS
jgi:4-coumarate--CoA ligase